MRRAFLLVLVPALVPPLASGQVGTPFCHGASCPCGNDDAAAGCGNHGFDGDRSTGATLSGVGSADVFADDLTLVAAGLRSGELGLVVMGDAKAPIPAGDGQICVGGGPGGLWRFPVSAADATGVLTRSSVVSSSQAFGATGSIAAGATWSFQAWYRDPGGPCGTGSNFSNGLAVTFEAAGTSAPVRADLAGRPLATYPWFEAVRNVNQGGDLFVAIDPTRMPWLVGVTGDLYLVAARTPEEWALDPVLVDARGGAQSWGVVARGGR